MFAKHLRQHTSPMSILSLTLRSSTYSRFVATTHRMSHVSSNSSDFSFFHNIYTRQRRGFLRCCLLLAARSLALALPIAAHCLLFHSHSATQERATGRRTTYAARLVDVFVLYGVRLFESSGFFFASLHHNSRSIDERLSDICFAVGLVQSEEEISEQNWKWNFILSGYFFCVFLSHFFFFRFRCWKKDYNSCSLSYTSDLLTTRRVFVAVHSRFFKRKTQRVKIVWEINFYKLTQNE